MEATTEPEQAANDIGDLESRPNYGQLFTQGKTETPKVETPAVTPVADTSLALPPSVLPKRPDHLSKQAMEPKEVFKRVKDSIFIVLAAPTMADAKQRNIALGSAVAISDHLLLTNCHVVKDRPVIKIVQNGKVTDAKLIAGRMSLDRCVLEVKEIELKAVAAIRSFDDLEKGERVVAIGTPNGNEQTLSEGLVSGLQARPGANIVQTTAPVSPGSSGGGLFDERGNLIGITFMQSLGRVQNLNSALAASDYWN
jgi:S1-C subfamily serine protease